MHARSLNRDQLSKLGSYKKALMLGLNVDATSAIKTKGWFLIYFVVPNFWSLFMIIRMLAFMFLKNAISLIPKELPI